MTGANVARAMQVSAPTVHEMIGRLEADGYMSRVTTRQSPSRTAAASTPRIVRRHRLIERFLTDVFDIPWDQVHEEAERLEHWMSPVVEERMLKAIGDSRRARTAIRSRRAARVRRAAGGCRARRPSPRHALRERGRRPVALPDGLRAYTGLEGTVAESGGDEVAIDADGTRFSVTRSVAETVSVPPPILRLPRVALPEQLVLAKEHWAG